MRDAPYASCHTRYAIRHTPMVRDPWLWGTLALGLATAFFRLDAHGLWGDEVWQAMWARQQDVPGTIARFSAPPDFPLHFILVQFTTTFSGEAFWVRLPSALLGALTAPLVYALGARVLDRSTGILAALLLAVAPFHVWFAQDARPYAALAFYSLLTLVFFHALLQKNSWGAWAGLTLATTLNLYNHFFALMPLLTESAAFACLFCGALVKTQWAQEEEIASCLATTRRPFLSLNITPALDGGRAMTAGTREWLWKAFAFVTSIGIAILLTAPLLRGYLSYILARAPGEVEAPPFQLTPAFLMELFGMFGGGTGWSLALLAVLCLIGIGVAAVRRNTFALTGALWLGLPLLILWIAQPRHIFIPRYFLFMQPVYFLFAAYGIAATSAWLMRRIQTRAALPRATLWRFVPTALLGGLVVVGLTPPTWQSYYVERINDWGTMCAYLHRHARPGDAVAGDGYIAGLMAWCNPGAIGVPWIDGNRVPPDSLTRRGLNIWFLNMDARTDEEWLRRNFELVTRATWGKPDLIVTASSGDFKYLQAERIAQLWYFETPVVPAQILFDDLREPVDAQGYAEIGKHVRYTVRLRLPATAPRVLQLTAQQREGGTVRVLVDGERVGRFVPKNDSREWRTVEFALPAKVGEQFLVELVNPIGTGARVRQIQVHYTKP